MTDTKHTRRLRCYRCMQPIPCVNYGGRPLCGPCAKTEEELASAALEAVGHDDWAAGGLLLIIAICLMVGALIAI